MEPVAPPSEAPQLESGVVRYGDRVCFLCEGQRLALTSRCSLSCQQVALLLASTLASGGLLGVLAWRRGLLRKQYAALLGDAIYAGDALAGPAPAVAFQLLAFDPSTQQLVLERVGQPVRFGEPLVVVHADSSRAIRFHARGGATVSRLPARLDVPRALQPLQRLQPSQVSPVPPTAKQDERKARTAQTRVRRFLPVFRRLTLAPRASRAKAVDQDELRGPTSVGTDDALESTTRHRPPRSASSASVLTSRACGPSKPLDRAGLQRFGPSRRRRQSLPHASQQPREAPVGAGSEQLFVASVRPVLCALNGDVAASSVSDDFLRWGTPMELVADVSGRSCGLRPRGYYTDSKRYLTTRASATTLLPVREHDDRSSLAEHCATAVGAPPRQVRLSVGTYNVWMMPRVVSAFTSVSPKKNTRARSIADVLPPCDVWVFTECFDHRARQVLLDKLALAGYVFVSPTVGHKRHRGSLRKALNGGVVLASKYPILSVRVKLFGAASAGADKLADKGVLYCKILKDGLLVHVFSTHLQAWNDPLSRAMRKAQMQLVAELMQAMDIDAANDVVLFVGDLNVNYWLNESNNEYDEMLELLEAADPRAAATAKAESKRARRFSFDPRVNALAAEGLSTDGSLELLDYVLYSRVHRQPREASSWIQPLSAPAPWFWRGEPQYNLSDHFPVVSAFTFET